MPEVTLTINGVSRVLIADPHETLLDTLRTRLLLTGTKEGCDQATCGACTVLLDDTPVLSCITPTLRCQGKTIRTVEGMAHAGRLHPVQGKLVDHGGIQCGFCTPGIVMTATAFLEEHPDPTEAEIREALSGNLCRCTGYTKIIEAVVAAAVELRK